MADEPLSLDGILGDDKPEAPAPAPVPAAPDKAAETPAVPPVDHVERVKSRKKAHQAKEFAAQAEGRVRDPDTGQFVTEKVEPAATPTPAAPAAPTAPTAPIKQEMTAQERAYLAAAQDERRKRQELEARLKALEAKSAEPEKKFWDDPEGAIKAMEQRTQEAISNTRIQTAESIARGRYKDFDEKIAVFGQIVSQNPWLAQQAMASPDPAEYSYRIGKNHQEMQQAGGLDAMRAKIEQETEVKVRAQLEAELQTKAEAAAATRAALPGSLSDARSTGTNRPVWGGVPSLGDVIGEKQ